MPTTRLFLASLLIAAPMLCAQQAQTRPAQPRNAEVKTALAPNVTHFSKPSKPAFEPLQLTITFRRIRSGKVSTQRTYTIAASSQQADPQIRDDARYPVKDESSDTSTPKCSNCPPQYFDFNNDVDIHNIREAGNTVSLTLCISTDNYAHEASEKRTLANTELSSHRYTVSPTVHMGKLATVYSLEDGVTNVRVEVLLLVEPLNKK
jgi:hypothetical protein